MIHEIPGNANRFAHELNRQGYHQNEIDHLAKQFAKIKQDIYIKKYLPELELRPGVENILQEAVARKIPLGIVSTSHEPQIHALLANQLEKFHELFKVVMGKESGRKTENGGYLYSKCLEKLELQPENVLVIEDSEPGLEAAICANIPTAVFYNDYTFGSAFKGARLVAPDLSTFSLKSLEKICLN
ncbi:NIF family HAD-type phosphatase [uncultured Cyclobacterium sp.]|uniref:HAD family hydrolase n=1 Tax=uncultured Cyclobacterium sp. TaxID=453820 RepID=UPI0030ED2786